MSGIVWKHDKSTVPTSNCGDGNIGHSHHSMKVYYIRCDDVRSLLIKTLDWSVKLLGHED